MFAAAGAAAGAPALVLFDEVLNFINRYRQMADPFHAFIQNLTVAMTGTTQGAAVISLPRSQVEMSDFDLAWQARSPRSSGVSPRTWSRTTRRSERGGPAAVVRPHRRRTVPEEDA